MYFLQVEYLSCQCQSLVWIDEDLNPHSGPLNSSFPDPVFSYNYYENGYKLNKVYKVTILNSSGFKKCEKNYNGNYFLVREFKQLEYGEELHRCSYDENHLVVTDSIERINYIYDETQSHPYTRDAGKQIGTDTVYGVEKRVFDHEKKLLSIHLYPLYNTNGGIKKKLEYPYGDSLFYTYDTCGNRNETTVYHSGRETKYTYGFSYGSGSVNNVYRVYVSYSETGEQWRFNDKGQLLAISAEHKSIFIEYNKNRIEKYITYFTFMGEKTEATYCYFYNTDGKLGEVRLTWNPDRYPNPMGDSSDGVKVIWYKNGLIKGDFSNNYLYSYRKRK